MTFSTRLSALALAGLVAVGASGCDNAGEAPAAGPVVQFGTNAVSVLEGSVRPDSVSSTTFGTRVTIPVRLTGANGTPVTVEVLYAEGPLVSTATPGVRNANGTFPTGVDFVDFGTRTGRYLTSTVTFSGAADETQNVTFVVVRDNVGEVSETAVFALQRVTGATLGPIRQFTANIGVPTIAAVRAGTLQSTVTVEGVVTRTLGTNVWIQDATGGFLLFGPAGSPIASAVALGTAPGGIVVGDRIQATGRLNEFQSGPAGAPVLGAGLLQVDNILAGGFSVLTENQPQPAAQLVTLAQLTAGDPDPDTYESEIIRVERISIDPGADVNFVAARNYTVSQTVNGTTTTSILRVGPAGSTQLIGTPIPTGVVTFEGPAGQFRGGNQLTPVLLTDLIR